jgi:hypothetical protein
MKIRTLISRSLLTCAIALVAITGVAYAVPVQYWDPNRGDRTLTASDITNLIPGLAGGAINNTPIGGTTPAAGAFTTLDATTLGSITPPASTVSTLHLDTGTKTATASSGAATLNKMAGVITSEALTTAAGATYTLTLTNSDIAATDQVFASVSNGTNSQGIPVTSTVTPGSNQVVIKIENNDLAAAFNGTIKIAFAVLKN